MSVCNNDDLYIVILTFYHYLNGVIFCNKINLVKENYLKNIQTILNGNLNVEKSDHDFFFISFNIVSFNILINIVSTAHTAIQY